ncbi:MAG: hypothetical protein F4X97_00140 [Boseongicola sp. SB0662_bin_57]|nr:hypothetical protein [Boseongicola sp. SB0662_bin_57]
MPLQAHLRRAAATLPRAQRVIRVSRGSLTVQEGGTATFDVWLSGRPRTGQTVTVAVTSTATGEATVSPASLTFDENDFGTRQTVTVTGVADADSRDENASVTLVATGGGYDDSTAVSVVVEDDDLARLRVTDSSLAFDSTTLRRTIGVRLATQPSGDVTVAASEDSARFSVTPASRTFGTSDWNVQQLFTVDATAGGSASGTLTLDPSGQEYETVASVTVPLAFTLTLPATPTGLSLSASYFNANTQQRVRATWNAAARATSYEVRYKKSTETNWTTVTGLSSTSYTANGADPNTTYDVQVQSRNASGPSGWSSTVQVTTGRSRGNLYLSGDTTNKIFRMAGGYSPTGAWNSGVSTVFTFNSNEYSQGRGIAFDQLGDLYFINTRTFGSLAPRIFRMAGGYGNSWDTGIPAPDSATVDIAFDASGNLYACGFQTGRIYRMSGGYSTTGTWDVGIALPSNETNFGGIAFDSAGNLYVTSIDAVENRNGKIHQMTGGYSTEAPWASSLSGPSGNSHIFRMGLSFDSDDGLYLLRYSSTSFKIFKKPSYATGAWDSGIAIPSGETLPNGIAFD